ncbi:MAG: hypothetical protein U0572_01550 [Phycisphaerales bacterium]
MSTSHQLERPIAFGATRSAARERCVVVACLVAFVSPALARQATVPAVPSTPAQTITPAATTSAQPMQTIAPAVRTSVVTAPIAQTAKLSPQELADLRAEYDASKPEERAALVAFYRDMGIDIEKLFAGGAAGADAPTAKTVTLVQAVQALDFARTPQAVLAARSQLGFKPAPRPDAKDIDALAKWIQLQVMAGEWDAFAAFLADASPTDSTGIYAHVLQSCNRPAKNDPSGKADPALLPEDVLALADASAGELNDWQLDVLSQLLKGASTKYGTGPMLARIAQGTRKFGNQDDAKRERTVRFLVAAGLVLDAYQYFPSLADARTRGDARVILNHGRYHQDLAAEGRAGGDPDMQRRAAWDLFCEVALMDKADAALRQDAMRRAIDLLPAMPPVDATKWLRQVFASESLGPAALEAIALKAGSLRDAKLDVAERAQTILTMKDAIDTLVAQAGVDIQMLRIPLRMLTSAIVGEAEAALNDRNRPRGGGVSREVELLLRALPGERWLEVLEPSIASRAYKTAISVANAADETDIALEYVANGAKRFPNEGTDLADTFLRSWEKRLTPTGPNQDDNGIIYWPGYMQELATAPLTRGRQRRNLERLATLVAVLNGIGVDASTLPSVAGVFRACHGRTEVFTRDGIEKVFGPVDKLAPDAAASLADQMRLGLAGDWKDKNAQAQAGMKRSSAEISALVEQGYELAIGLIDRAIAQRPESWRYAVTKAALTYDRVQFKQAEQKADFATYNQYRKEAFAAFQATAEKYAELVAKGAQRDDAGVYLAWFNAAVGSSELNYLTREDLLIDGSPQDDQIDLIVKAMKRLPDDARDRHVGAFARAISDGVPRLAPEVKPRVIRHAMRIIGDHPAGASLQRLVDLYQDLVKDEIKLRIAIDGSDRVGAGKRFGALLSVRFTTAVDRETGGLTRYLQNDVWTRVGNQMRPMNYRDMLKKSIESALAEHFEIDGLGFFDALTPPRPVKEGGEDGWLEKPFAYLVLRAKDPSVDRVPQITMDTHFNDSIGPVTLPLLSNAPPIDAASAPGERPLRKLDVTQTLDLRGASKSDKDRAITLEVHASGDGVVPDLEELLDGVRTALPGYEIGPKGIDERPLSVAQSESDGRPVFMRASQAPPKEEDYVKPDDSGFYRLATERSWMITFTPTGATVGTEFTLPALKQGLDGKVTARQFSDMDLVTVTGRTVAVVPPILSTRNLVIAGVVVAAAIAGMWMIRSRRRAEPVDDALHHMPTRITPLSVIATLRRIESESGPSLDAPRRAALAREIETLESQYFGPQSGADQNGTLRAALDRWIVVGR